MYIFVFVRNELIYNVKHNKEKAKNGEYKIG